MLREYTALIKEDAGWWIGWIEEIPGVNCQEATREELLESLRVTLREAIDFNRQEALGAALNKRSAMPRHTEINDHLARKICRDLAIPKLK